VTEQKYRNRQRYLAWKKKWDEYWQNFKEEKTTPNQTCPSKPDQSTE